MMAEKATLAAKERAAKVRLLLMDVDGTLTDGKICIGNDGEIMKAFDVRDGLGLDLWHRDGRLSGIITGRQSEIVKKRAAALKIKYISQGQSDKRAAYAEIKKALNLPDENICFIGDDLIDIPLLRRVGFAVAVADAAEEAKAAAHFVTQHRGGGGAVRETIEFILKTQNRWEELLKIYYE